MDIKDIPKWYFVSMAVHEYFSQPSCQEVPPVGDHVYVIQEEPLALQRYPTVLVFGWVVVLSMYACVLFQVTSAISTIGASDMRACLCVR